MGALAEQRREEDYTKDSIESKSWGRITLPEKYLWISEINKFFNQIRSEYGPYLKGNFIVQLDDEIILEIPNNFDKLYESIEKSKYILDLEDDWDDEGSPAYDKTTWIRAIKFIYNYTKKVYDEYGIKIGAPKISQGPEGSIDILWKKKSYRLLINIPQDPKKPASYYGDDYNDEHVKGAHNTNNITRWLALSYLHLL